ncbi:MAG: Hsp70 family protein [Planctomycetaceae bacterium]|nr:Hsp70 family protein [Planctomycetaceae bacterium]
MTAAYVIGVDLGTTNSVVAYASLQAAEHPTIEHPTIEQLKIPQLTAPGTVESKSALPSFIYLPPDHELGSSFDLPWQSDREMVVGQMARDQSAAVPDRSIGAAKSWLTHSRVDRHDAILPWKAPNEINKISPVIASQCYLEHVIHAWNRAFPDAPFDQQQVVLTVPASFDVSARELTREAATLAGVPANFVLLEEPQAAVYAWLAGESEKWRERLQPGDQLLVVDVGGGTTDLSLIGVADQSGELALQRVAVGNHLLVGGDNMDLAIAHHAAEQFKEKGVALDAWQSVSLWHACRAAKEKLLSTDGPSTHPVAVLGRGSKLIGGTVTIDLQREEVVHLLTEGFFPPCQIDEHPARQRQSGFVQLGLPFEADTRITRHIAQFLTSHGANDSAVQPTHVLFNGGVFRTKYLRDRFLHVMDDWFASQDIRQLNREPDLDSAVARGAAYYGWAKQHGGVRIRGGTARSYYIGIETSGLAIPGAPRPLKALCVVPFGMEEGSQLDVPSEEIGLVLGESVQFRFFSSSTRKQDQPGDVLDRWSEEELQETDSLETELAATTSGEDDYVPVRFQSRVTELGVFELWCVSRQSDDRWRLEFSVRE